MTQPPPDSGLEGDPSSAPEDAPHHIRRLPGSTALRLAGVAAVALALATLALGGGQVVPALSSTDSVADGSYVRYEAHGCYGTCPQFVVTVCSDGSVSYVGHRFVDETGRVEYAVSERRAHRLLSLAREVDFFDFGPEYEDNLVDDPSASLAVGLDGETHRVHFERNVAPDGLLRLADAVESVAHPYADQQNESATFRSQAENASAVCRHEVGGTRDHPHGGAASAPNSSTR